MRNDGANVDEGTSGPRRETDTGDDRDGSGTAPPASGVAGEQTLASGDQDRQARQAKAQPEAKKGITVRGTLQTIAMYLVIFPLVFLYLIVFSPKCSSESVDNTVQSIVEDKLLHLKRFSVGLSNIKVLQHDIFGDEKCSADLVIDGKQTFRRVEYHWDTRRGSVSRVYAQMTF